jgi:hypothetical protein
MEQNQRSSLIIRFPYPGYRFWRNTSFARKAYHPKKRRIGKDVEEAKVKALLGPNINKNEYRFCHKNDEKLIVHVEMLWMAMHQKT